MAFGISVPPVLSSCFSTHCTMFSYVLVRGRVGVKVRSGVRGRVGVKVRTRERSRGRVWLRVR